MKARKFFLHALCGVLLLCAGRVYGQATVLGNSGGFGDHLGWDALTPQALDIRHDGNYPIDWYTNAIQRVRLNPNLTGGLGQFGGINRDGFMLISGTADAFTNAGSRAPFTRLHLVDEAVNPTQPNVYAQQLGFRPWQRNGVTFTGNSDQGYVGQKYAGDDNTDLVVQWSDNPETQPWGCDRMKFVFSSTYIAGIPRGMNSYDGMEAMRFWPKSGTEVNVGIGDFAPPAIGDPTERLDILDGNVRIRALPDAGNQATGPFKYMVVDDSPLGNAQRGVVRWTTLPVDCKWNQFGGVNNNDLWTAVGAATDCPNYDNFVGIGTQTPWGKLHVKWTGPLGLQNAYGLFSELDGEATGKTAGHFQASGGGDSHKGVESRAEGALTENLYSGNFAVDARATANAEGYTTSNRGVFAGAAVEPQNEVKFNWALDASASVANNATVHNNFGASGVANHFGSGVNNYGGYFESWAPNGVTNGYGLFSTAAGATNNWAGFFAGDVQAGGTFIPSDASLKSDIADAATSDMGEVLAQLSVHSYTYNTDMFPQMNLPQGQQVGFLAQEVESVAPALVKDAVHPARFNADGEQVSEEVSYKAVNYTGLVPHLVSGHQSQGQQIQQLQEMVAAQGAQLAQMQEMLAACCAASPTDSDHRMQLENGGLLFGKDRALVIQPNPFSEPPTVLYTLERAGRMQLIANSADGKQLSVLHEAAQDAGDYQLVWDTSALQPGMYYLTLLLDGEPVVKKAVKVGR